MSLQRAENPHVVANDLEIYFRGFEVALKKKNLEDAIRYLESMIGEIDYNIDHLQPVRDGMFDIDSRKRDIENTISTHPSFIRQLEKQLKSL